MRKSAIVFIELGMLSCIILAAIVLPEKTPLREFLAVSAEFLLIGNYLVVKSAEDTKSKSSAAEEHKWKWSRIIGIFAVIDIPWILSQFLNNGK